MPAKTKTRKQVQYLLQQEGPDPRSWVLARPDRDLGYPLTFFKDGGRARATEAFDRYCQKYPRIRFRVVRRVVTVRDEVIAGVIG